MVPPHQCADLWERPLSFAEGPGDVPPWLDELPQVARAQDVVDPESLRLTDGLDYGHALGALRDEW